MFQPNTLKTETSPILDLKIASREARARIRSQAFRMYQEGSSVYSTDREFQVTPRTVFNWFKRFKDSNGELFEERKRGPEACQGSLLAQKQQKKLAQVLTDKTPD